MEVFSERLRTALEQRRTAGLYRQRLTLESAQGPLVQVGGANT